MTEGIRVVVDTDICALAGYCERIAPEYFTIADHDSVTVPSGLITDGVLVARVREAEAVCPTGALRVDHAPA